MYRMPATAAVLLLGTLSCPAGEPLHREPTPVPIQAAAASLPTTAPPDRARAPALAREKAPAPARDRYADWMRWSEDHHQPECFKLEECQPDRTGSPTICVKPTGSGEGDPGKCRPQPLNRRRQKIQRENQRVIVDAICRPPKWYEAERDAEGRACWRFEWRTAKQCKAKEWCNPEKLHRFLRIPAKRESTWNHRTDHRLDKDLIANMASFRRMYGRGERNPYKDNPHFFEGLSIGKKGRAVFGRGGKTVPRRYCLPMRPWDDEPAPSQNGADRNCNGVPDRWDRGYGWYGLNASNFTFAWDPLAPPEVLARRVPATLAVLRRARAAWRKLTNGIDCLDAGGAPWTKKNRRPSWKACKDPKSDRYGDPDCRAHLRADLAKDTWQKPTWASVHRAVWGGDVCPNTMDDVDFRERMFANRANRVELDPSEEISLQMLGDPVAKDRQWELVDRLEPQFVAVFTPGG
jgi:hypothetical protein